MKSKQSCYIINNRLVCACLSACLFSDFSNRKKSIEEFDFGLDTKEVVPDVLTGVIMRLCRRLVILGYGSEDGPETMEESVERFRAWKLRIFGCGVCKLVIVRGESKRL